jgi:hypothetical protein
MVNRPMPVERVSAGRYQITLHESEHELLKQLLGSLRELISAADDRTRRLFPTAYADDPEKDAGYQAMVRDELVSSRLSAIQLIEDTPGTTVLDGDAMAKWLEAINSLRLVLGTILDVHEDMPEPDEDDPTIELFWIFEFLAYLVDAAVRALTLDLPEPTESD